VVPRLYIAHLGAYGFDDTSGFVAEHDGGRTGVEPLLEVHVAVADARCGSPHADLVGPRGTNVHIFNSQWLMHSAKNSCFHCCLLLRILVLSQGAPRQTGGGAAPGCCALLIAPAKLARDNEPYAVPRQTGGGN
jgi:hypothetical protein